MEILQSLFLHTIKDPICRNHTGEILRHLKSSWAMRMVDATAKVPVGLLTGHLTDTGNIDECLDVKATTAEHGNFTGKYCVVNYPLAVNVSSKPLEYKWAACIPSSCSARDLARFLNKSLSLSVHVNELECVTRYEKPYQPEEIATFVIIGVLLILALLSTLYDIFAPSGKKNLLLQSFSIKDNMKILLNVDTPEGPLEYLHGMRVFCLYCVVLAHTYMTKIPVGNDINRKLVLTWLSDWEHVWMTNRGVLVDAFFVIGGLLASYTFFKYREKGKKFSCFWYYVHRYMRMAPALAMQLLFEATLMNRLGSGPGWKSYSAMCEKSCRNGWWKHLLFINNWWGIEYCLEHTWYVAADMQLNLLAPILLIPLYWRPRLGLGLTYGFLIVMFCTSFGLSYGLEEKVDLIRNAKWSVERKLYRGTYNRAVPWLIGFLLGYYLHKYKYMSATSGWAKFSTNVWERLRNFLLGVVMWIVVLCIMVGASTFTVHRFIQPEYVYNALDSATYISLSHVAVALGGALAIVLCWSGYGGPFNLLFSWRLFLPLSRASYSMYLIHLLIVKVRLGDVRTTTFLSDYELVMHSISIFMITVLSAPSLFLLVECPFSKIEAILQYLATSDEPLSKEEPEGVRSYGTIPVTQCSRGQINDAFELSNTSNIRKQV